MKQPVVKRVFEAYLCSDTLSRSATIPSKRRATGYLDVDLLKMIMNSIQNNGAFG